MLKPTRLLLTTICCAGFVSAQEPNPDYPKLEGFAGYSAAITTYVTVPLLPLNGYGQVDLDAKRGFEQRPGAGIEIFEETRVKDDACRVAMTPFDRELPAIDEIGHAQGGFPYC